MECLLCSRADSSVFERSGLLMCKACYDAGVAADMAVARVYRFEPADHVADNIFLGPEGATIDDAWLREKGITRVLTVAAHSDHLTKHASIEYMQIDVDDDPNELLRPHFEAAFAFMREDAATNVLVHCVSGISRSATVVTAYLMATRKLPFEAALALVRERRPRWRARTAASKGSCASTRRSSCIQRQKAAKLPKMRPSCRSCGRGG